MARKKRKTRGWISTLLFYLLFPLIVWLGAFLLWFYWYDLERLFLKPSQKARPAPVEREVKQEKRAAPATPDKNRSQEKILDEEREKLDAILKRLQQRKKAADDGP